MSPAGDSVAITRTGRRLDIVLNRPERANALAPQMVETMLSALEEAAGDDQVRLCTLRGEGRHFCAGFDLSDLADLSDGDLLWRLVRIETLLQRVHSAPFPVLALAHGKAVGAGADLFVASSWRTAAPGTQFRFPGLNFDIALGTRRLAAAIGTAAARDCLIDIQTISSQAGVQLGLVHNEQAQSEWPAAMERMEERATVLSADTARRVLRLTSSADDAADLAALVQSACRPGLRHRIERYANASRHVGNTPNAQ